uniref:Uncharacterized protein n=1 Tax=Anguilla anguilla TaxID=7936 RepID=A0A0E9T4L6_ANGAN
MRCHGAKKGGGIAFCCMRCVTL